MQPIVLKIVMPIIKLSFDTIRSAKSRQSEGGTSLYRSDDDFLFPSLRRNGTQPLMPDMVLKKVIRPALERAGVTGKTIGWHSFRHSLAANLRILGVDAKVA